jgi:drug/metabolite transporter (DMT)-like permease
MIARPGKVTLRDAARCVRVKRHFAGISIVAGLLFCRILRKRHPRRGRRYVSEFGFSAALRRPFMAISHRKFGLLLGFIGMCLFAGTLPATRLALSEFDVVFLTAARAAIAGSAGLVLLTVLRRRIPPRSLWPELVGAALFTVVGFPLLAALAMVTVPAAHGGVVLGIIPLATAAAAAVFAHERPSAGFWLSSVIGAILVLAFMLRRNGGGTVSAGDLFLLGTVACGALGYTLSGRLAAGMPGWEVISWQVVIFLPAAALATVFMWPADIASAPISAWVGLGYVGFVANIWRFLSSTRRWPSAASRVSGKSCCCNPS